MNTTSPSTRTVSSPSGTAWSRKTKRSGKHTLHLPALFPGEQRRRCFLRLRKIRREARHALGSRVGLVQASLLPQGLRQQQVASVGGLHRERARVLANGLGQVAIFLGDQSEFGDGHGLLGLQLQRRFKTLLRLDRLPHLA